jgi:transposase
VLSRFSSAPPILEKNAELAARLKLAESIAQQRQSENEALKKALKQLQDERTRYCERVVLLEEELRWLKAHYFGASSQKSEAAEIHPDQPLLFNEAEVLAAIEAADEAHRTRTTKVEAHERKHTGGRKSIPPHFPRIPIVHDLPAEQKVCTRCATPHPLTRIGEEVRECYRFEPPKISVEQHIRPTYACEQCHEWVVTAPAPAVILPKSMASPSLLAYLITSKFVDGLPLFRVSRQLERSGMDLSPGTAGSWVNTIGREKILPLINVMHEELLAQGCVHMDETFLQVLRSHKAPSSDHFMVVRAAGPPGRRIILFNYIPARTTEALKQLLVGPEGPYRGKLLTDGLERYDEICRDLRLPHFGCWQHCRQYYFKARKVSQLPSVRTLANAALEEHIRAVFAVEDEIEKLREEYARRGEELPAQTALRLRQSKSKPVLEKFKVWVEDLLPGTPPKSALGQALTYTHNQWEKLTRYLDHADVPAHNNYVEQQIKQFAVGRKAWLFNHDKLSAQASANLFSLVLTCRVNEVEPYAYLCHLLDVLPTISTAEALEALLPWNAKPLLAKQNQPEKAVRAAAT